MSTITSLAPIIDERSRILILGSIPGVQSLAKQEYYGNPRNHFWPILYTLFDREVEADYADRIRFIQQRGIALWDVIRTCNRKGSLDANIQQAVLNPIPELLQDYPAIRWIGLNGTKAYTLFHKHVAPRLKGVTYHKLPSTSPIPGKNVKRLEEKLQDWSIIIDYLDREWRDT